MYRVALALGKTVRELQGSMDIDEFLGWAAFFRLHGWPDSRHEFYAAQLASLMVSLVSGKGRKYSTSDFMLDEILESQQEKDDRELMQYLNALAEKQNAK